jgi:uncharacterized membrane protein
MWALFAGIATVGAAAMPLLHQHFKPDSASMLFWLRLISFAVMAPVVLVMGAPVVTAFYLGTVVIALWMSVVDVIYFNAVKKHGAGVVARILPGAALATFFLWFAFDPGLIDRYIAAPERSALIIAVMGFGVWCAAHLTRDPVSFAAVRDIWFVIFSAIIGPIAVKIVLGWGDNAQTAPLAFIAVQGIVVAVLYLTYQMVKKPVPMATFIGRYSLMVGALVAVASMMSIGGRGYALQFVDNPAYVSMVALTAPVLISLYERWIGRPDASNQWAGMGLLLAAVMLVGLQLRAV